MTIGGSFYIRGRKDVCTADRNVFVRNVLDGTNQFQEIDIKGGKEAVSKRDDAQMGEKEFGITNGTGRGIFEHIMSLDGDGGTLTMDDFQKISEKDLQQKFKGANVKVDKNETNKSVKITYKYQSLGETWGLQNATLTIDFESEAEQKTREAKEKADAEAKKAKDLEQAKKAKEEQEKINKKRKEDEDWKNNYNDPISKFLKWLGY